MTTYYPDTCPCILEYDSTTGVFVDWKHKCELHKNLDDTDLFDAIKTQNKNYQVVNPTKTELVQNISDKVIEKKRIRDMGDGLDNV